MNENVSENGTERRISIFIGSSTESLPAARALKLLFDEKLYNVDIWDEGIFEKGKSNIDNLLKFSDTYDYAIFMFVPDDEIVIRKAPGKAARHNVVFEFGLFLGRIGSKKTFIVAEDSIKDFIKNIFTDLQGVSLGYTFKFDYERINDENIIDELKESLEDSAVEIQKMIGEYGETLQLGFLPSTALAIGYFENFINQIYTQLLNLRTGALGRDKKFELGKLIIDMYGLDFRIYIVIPPNLSEASHKNLSSNLMELNLVYEKIITPSRSFTVYHKEDLLQEIIVKEGIQLFDIPSTLFSSLKAIELLSKEPMIKQLMVEKEIANFVKALKTCIKADERMKNHVIIVSLLELKEKIL